ncbi:PIR protein, putative [Plasmodium sp.]|nr:PIR protein, putative [Plasmodium sp.]
MIEKRKKCKEQCDKDIQKIILKDKIEKSLEEKVEKVCLRCGFGLGGVAAGVGIFGAIAVNEWTKAALVAAAQKGIEVGISKAITDLGNIVQLSQFNLINWAAEINGTNFLEQNSLVAIVNGVYNKCTDLEAAKDTLFCQASYSINSQVSSSRFTEVISQEAARAAGEAAKNAEKAQIALVNEESTHLYSAIGYSVIAILIILLVMVIIYLILRYRRKKKMNKKLQYTKLLNQ